MRGSRFLTDLKTSINLNIKLLKSSKTVVSVIFFSIIIFAATIATISNVVEERSKIPIGIFDSDNSTLSKKLVKRLENTNFILLYQEEKEQLEKKLEERIISGYFIIKEGYEESITEGNVIELLEMYYKSDKGVFSMVSDIVAGEMIEDICAGRTWLYYETLKEKYPELDHKELFSQYVEQTKEQKGKNLKFDIEMVDLKKDLNVTEQYSNSLLYKQVIIGIISILFGFLIMTMIGTLHYADNKLVRKRRKISDISNKAFSLGQIVSIMIIIVTLAIMGSLFLLTFMWNVGSSNCIHYLVIVITTFLELIVVDTVLLYFIGKYTSDKLIYPIVGTFFVMGTGAVGMLGFFDFTLLNISKFMPNYWFIAEITDIMVSGL